MRTIAPSHLLLREQTELPAGLRLATEDFREGWGFLRSGGAEQLERRIRTKGWNLLRMGEGSLRSGVGESSQAAIASALKLALRQVNAHFNAAEVQQIDLTQYPWFFLARVRVLPYRIQQSAAQPIPQQSSAPIATQPRHLAPDSAEMFPNFATAMPMLKEMLVSARSVQSEP
jgi:hypothetical protein